jgi:hypothetical protein
MPVHNTPPRPARPVAAALVLTLARQLHKSATSDSRALSLPVLRRVIASGTLRDIDLPELYRRRSTVQRKHVLRTLAVEAGFASWEEYRPALNTMTADQLAHFDLTIGRASYPNIWFPSKAEAITHADKHGGHVMSVGEQGVVIPELAPC